MLLLLLLLLFANEQTYLLIPCTENKIVGYVHKSINMMVKLFNVHRYKIHDMQQRASIVDLLEQKCCCGKIQLLCIT